MRCGVLLRARAFGEDQRQVDGEAIRTELNVGRHVHAPPLQRRKHERGEHTLFDSIVCSSDTGDDEMEQLESAEKLLEQTRHPHHRALDGC